MHLVRPVIPGFHPDPSICRVGADYFLVTSSFEYFPGIPIFHSTDLVNWTKIGHCVTRADQVDLSRVPDSGGLWAPTIRHHDGVFYVSCTILDRANFTNELSSDSRNHDYSISGRHFIVCSDDPRSEWSDPVWVDGAGFDPSLLFDDDRVFFTYASRGSIRQSEIDVSTGELVAEDREIWRGTGEMSTEGPHLYQIEGYYYLIVAEGGTSYGHSISCARSRTPWGPWELHPDNPLISQRTHADDPIQATGHGDLVRDSNGEWWMVFLAIRAQGYPKFHNLGRETFITRIRWDGEWPYVDSTRRVEREHFPADRQLTPRATWRDEFSAPSLGVEWNYLRSADSRVSIHNGRLRLESSPGDGQNGEGPTFVGIRQTQTRGQATARFAVPPAFEGEFGISVRMNDRHSYELVVGMQGKMLAVRLRRRLGGIVDEGKPELCPMNDTLELGIEATPFAYFFTMRAGGDPLKVGSGEAVYLSSEVAGGFTGVYFGLFAHAGAVAEVSSFEVAYSS